jgi:VWFA-related protein
MQAHDAEREGRKRGRPAIAAISIGLALTLAAGGQDQKPLRHEVSVTLKLVQVLITDKAGNPVTDLGRDDFVLTDDGQAVKLTEFEVHKLPVSVPTPEKAAAAPAPPAPEKVLLNRKIFFFFDFMNSTTQGARKAAEAALHFVDTGLLPTDEVGVITLSAIKGIQVFQMLSSDRAEIHKSIASFGLAGSSGRAEELEGQYQRLKEAGGFADAREGKLSYMGNPAAQAENVVINGDRRYLAKTAIERMNRFAQALRYIPGQKTLVLFTTGLEASLIMPSVDTVVDGSVRVSHSDPQDMNADLRTAYEALCKELATSNVAVYPMNTEELNAASEVKTGAATLRFMADATGGRYYGNIFNYKENITRFQAVTAAYYVLGYPVADAWDGKFHKIRVTVRRPGCLVRTPEGYFASRAFSDLDPLEKKMHLVDLALSDHPLSQQPVRFDMAVLPSSDGSGGRIVLVARVPLRELRDRGARRVEAVSLLFDGADAIVAEERSEEDLGGIPDAFAGFAASFPAPEGRTRCRIVVRDLETGTAAVAGETWVPPAAGSAGFALTPPLLLKPDRGAALLKIHPLKLGGNRPAADAMSALLGFDARQYAPFFGRTLAAESEILAVLPCLGEAAGRAKPKISAFLKDKLTFADLPVGLAVLSEKPIFGGRIYLVRMALPSVEPDEYTLRLIAEDPESGAASEVARDYLIEKTGTAGAGGWE